LVLITGKPFIKQSLIILTLFNSFFFYFIYGFIKFNNTIELRGKATFLNIKGDCCTRAVQIKILKLFKGSL